MHSFQVWCLEPEVVVDSVKCNGGNDGKITVKITESHTGYTIRLMDAENNRLLENRNLFSDSIISFLNCSAGKYLIQLIFSGSSEEYKVTVDEPQKLEANVIEIVAVYGQGESVTADLRLIYSGGTPPYSIQWLENSNNQTGEIAKGLGLGIYSCNLNDKNNCGPASATFFLFEDEIEKYNQTNIPQNEKL